MPACEIESPYQTALILCLELGKYKSECGLFKEETENEGVEYRKYLFFCL